MSSNKELNEIQKGIINRLFMKLATIYGNGWRNQFKTQAYLEEAKKQWQDALKGYDEVILHKAVKICREHHKFPPNIPEFIACCKHANKKDNFFKPEKVIKAPKEVADKNLNQIYQIVGRARPSY